MTEISVTSTSYQYEKRGWLWGLHGTEQTPSVTLDLSTFVAGTHYPNGYILSGCALAKITATGLYGPFDAGASDGRQLTTGGLGVLFSSVKVTPGATKVGAAKLVHGFVDAGRLPFQSGSGSATAAFKSALPMISWES
jgi:hypothetical protein